MWWLFFQWRDETNTRLEKLEARVDTIEHQLHEIALCLKAMTRKLN